MNWVDLVQRLRGTFDEDPSSEEIDRIKKAFCDLPAESQKVMEFFYRDGKKLADIAVEMGFARLTPKRKLVSAADRRKAKGLLYKAWRQLQVRINKKEEM